MTDRVQLRRVADGYGWTVYEDRDRDLYVAAPYAVTTHYDSVGRFVRAVLTRDPPVIRGGRPHLVQVVTVRAVVAGWLHTYAPVRVEAGS